MKKIFTILLMITILSYSTIVNAMFEKPNEVISIEHNGAYVIDSDNVVNDTTYASVKSNQNALLVTSGTSTLNSITINKSGNGYNEQADFYGTNAGILVINDSVLNINDSTINTNGNYANGVFSYGNGTVNIKNSTINTTSDNSGGIMAAGGGNINANDLTIDTSGNSSAAIRSDRGGGKISVNRGTYKTTGEGSPVIYSTADIKVSNSTLESTSSEGVVIEGKNSVTLNNVTLTDTNSTLHGNSETYKNIFLYQSMSGDSEVGNSEFTANNSKITTNKGDTFYVTNTAATINLNNNEFINKDGDFLRIESSKWGNNGSNGGIVTLNLDTQEVEGNIIVDDISKLSMNLVSSTFKGSIDNANKAKEVTLKIDDNSIFVLTGNSYVDKLDNGNKENTNIYSNGYNLYVNGVKVLINDDDVSNIKTNSNNNTVINPVVKNYTMTYIVLGILSITIALLVVLIITGNKKRKKGLNG